MIDLPKFKIGNLEINLIQGGMGVGISGKNLASAVANCGGAGIIAGVALGLLNGHEGGYAETNRDALRDEIRDARKMSNGVIGVNIMHALTDFEGLVGVAVDEKVDLIISGAGMAFELPKLVGDADVALVPIVSNERVANLITRRWKKQHKIPDAFILEGPEAGGHLAFDPEDLVENVVPKLEDLMIGLRSYANDPKNFETPVPVVVAGGIYTGGDIARYNQKGIAGVQMATRFVTTRECDAELPFKQAYIDATPEDLVIIKSPVGLPGRAIRNTFLDRVIDGDEIDFRCNFKCLKTCKPKESPYCIVKALIGAQKGDFREGFVFAGANAYKATPENCLDEHGEFITVRTLMERLSDEYKAA